MLISPNSIIGIPAEQKNELATTIIQQAGSVLFEVEKRNVKHFEVETPYLAAVVKGTQFNVSVTKHGANVGVRRGQVEVADHKSGQHALVLPGQTAKVSTLGPGGLSLGGAGKLNPVERGEPRRSSVNAVPVPAKGLTAPSSGSDGQTVRALRNPNAVNGSTQLRGADGAPHIKLPLGEVNVNFHKVTNGLARDATAAAGERANAAKPTVWSSGELTPGNGAGKLSGTGNGNASGDGMRAATAAPPRTASPSAMATQRQASETESESVTSSASATTETGSATATGLGKRPRKRRRDHKPERKLPRPQAIRGR